MPQIRPLVATALSVPQAPWIFMPVHRTSNPRPDHPHELLDVHPLDPFPGNLVVPKRPTGIDRPRTAPDRDMPVGDVAPTDIPGQKAQAGTRRRTGGPPDGDPQLPSWREQRSKALSHQDSPDADQHRHRRCDRGGDAPHPHGPRCGTHPSRRDRPAGNPPVDHFSSSMTPGSSPTNDLPSPKTRLKLTSCAC